jgi:hypothetical protein
VAFRCTLPIELSGPAIAGGPVDRFDEIVVSRLAEETLWCEDVLWLVYDHEGTWAGVARKLYLSPYLFEACFGVDLYVDGAGFVRYPDDEEIVWGIQRLESLAYEGPRGQTRNGFRARNAALLAIAMGAVAGLVIGF